jgi:putative RNA 2'-phosphotransferase
MDLIQLGKQIAYILRHNPGKIHMDDQGWIYVNDLLTNLAIPKSALDIIVQYDDKNRYSYSDDGLKIRANQGHSLSFVKINFKEIKPPKILYHGTSPAVKNNILKTGILKRSRNFVHLSDNKETAYKVGLRHSSPSEPIIFNIDSEKMYNDGIKFYLSDNNVWLVDIVLPKYIL